MQRKEKYSPYFKVAYKLQLSVCAAGMSLVNYNLTLKTVKYSSVWYRLEAQ